jgi:DNA-binding GntR family transcriptional regulator
VLLSRHPVDWIPDAATSACSGGAATTLLQQARYTALRDEVFESLQQAIVEGRLAAGTRLVEAEVAGGLNVSKTPVREAIIRLERLGLVISRPRRGTFVADISPAILKEIFVARGLIEGYVAAEAATRASPDVLLHLEALVALIGEEDERGDRSAVSTSDLAFHDTIYQASGNTMLLQIWRGFRDQIRLYHRMSPLNPQHITLPSNRNLHQEIVDALRTRNPGAARLAAEVHLRRAVLLLGLEGADDLLASLGSASNQSTETRIG